MEVVIDNREKHRIDEAKKYYNENYSDLEVKVEKLPYGDYVFNNEVAFEFKNANDFVSSSINNSIISQVLNQNDNFKYSFLIISGDIESAIKQSAYCIKNNKPYNKKLEEYKMLVEHISRLLRIICPVIHTPNDNEAFELMFRQAKTCLKDTKFLQTVRLANTVKNPAVRYLTCSKDIGIETANLVCNYYNISNLRQLLDLDKDKLLQIKGIGEKKTDLILKTI